MTLDDLTILLKMQDKTGAVFKSVDNRINKTTQKLNKLQRAGKAVGSGLVKVGLSVGAVIGAALVNGTQQLAQLTRMSGLLGENVQEVTAFYETFRSQNALVNIDALTDAALTLKERFSEARVETGELFNFGKDFGLDFNTAVTGTNAQMVEFLDTLKQLPDAGDRSTTAIAVLGDTGAHQLLPMLQNIEDIDTLIKGLSETIENTPNFMSAGKLQAVDDYRDSVNELSAAWDGFSREVTALIAPALEFVNEKLAAFVGWVTSGIDKLGKFLGIFDENAVIPATTIGGLEDQIKDFTDRLNSATAKSSDDVDTITRNLAKLKRALADAKDTESLGSGSNKPSGIVSNEYGRFESMDAFKKFMEDQQREIDKVRAKAPEMVEPFEVVSLKDKFLTDLNAANAERDAIQEGVEFRNDLRAQEIASIGTLASAFSTAGSAFAQFSATAKQSSEKAFKVFKGLQIAAATASAYAGAAQALADFSSLSTLDKIGRAATVLSIGLGYVSQISRLTASGNTGGGSAGASASAGATSPQNTARGGTAPTESRSAGRTIVQLEGRDRTYDQTDIENIVDALKNSGADIEVLYN